MRSNTKIHVDNGLKLSAGECGNLTWFEIVDLAEPYMPSQFQSVCMASSTLGLSAPSLPSTPSCPRAPLSRLRS